MALGRTESLGAAGSGEVSIRTQEQLFLSACWAPGEGQTLTVPREGGCSYHLHFAKS